LNLFEESEATKEAERKKLLAETVEMMDDQNAFQILNVDYSAQDEKIQQQFDSMILKFNKERSNASRDSAQEIDLAIANLKKAYNEIKDKSSRLQYLKKLFLEEGIFTKETKEVINYGEIIDKGKEYLARKDVARAHLLFLNSLKIFPNIGLIHAYLGYTNFMQIGSEKEREAEILNESRKHFTKALMLSPDDEEPHLFYGKMLKYLGRDENAKKEFTKVIQINPDNKDALQELRLFNIRDRKKNSSFIKWKK
jgi:tetratricopeptide (TPR) repeat protein